MSTTMQMTMQQAIRNLQLYGYRECTKVANRQNGVEYLCAFERAGDEHHVFYCCMNLDDLFSLWSLVEKSMAS